MLSVTFTFILVLLAWVFFRAENLKSAVYILHSIFSPQMRLFIEGGALSNIVYGLIGFLALFY
jgi:D-alanyl-lipoteichoic acid acyltransferase DltB (MBOAT superfamily)